MAAKARRRLFLGLDTSAYTASLSLVDEAEQLIWEKRAVLPVQAGKLGLRQSEAVFAHLLALPALWREGADRLKSGVLAAVAASVRPRPLEGSYMPVFKVGEAFGAFLAQSMGLLFLPSSHQEGHLLAGLWSAGLPQGRYLALHLSGGTTEILAVNETAPGELRIATLGGTTDLNAGQFIDRLGVAMGLKFPAGPALEQLARAGSTGAIALPVAVKGTAVSFSGPASHARRLLEKGYSREDLARAAEVCIADSLARAAAAAQKANGPFDGLLLAGGVAANAFIRQRLERGLPETPVYCALPAYSGDNATGLAVQAARRCRAQGGQ